MAKFKTAKGKPKQRPTKGLVPCLLLIISGIALVSMLFYGMLSSAK